MHRPRRASSGSAYRLPRDEGQLTRVGDRFAGLFDPIEVLPDHPRQLKTLLAEVDICLPNHFTIGPKEPF